MAKKSTKVKKKRPSAPATRHTWPVQEARAHLSAVIDAALTGKPQRITRNGKETVVLVRESDFAPGKKFATTKEWLAALQNSPLSELIEEGLVDFEAMRRESPLGPPVDLPDRLQDT